MSCINHHTNRSWFCVSYLLIMLAMNNQNLILEVYEIPSFLEGLIPPKTSLALFVMTKPLTFYS